MTLLEDIEAKLADALGQVERVTAQLNDFSNIKQSLQSTDEGLKAAADKLGELSSSLEKGASALERAAASLSETNGIISKTDPAEILKELTAITSQNEEIGKSLKANLLSDKEELSGAIARVPDEVHSILDASLRETQRSIQKANLKETEKLTTQAKASATKAWVLVTITLVNTALLAFLIFKPLT